MRSRAEASAESFRLRRVSAPQPGATKSKLWAGASSTSQTACGWPCTFSFASCRGGSIVSCTRCRDPVQQWFCTQTPSGSSTGGPPRRPDPLSEPLYFLEYLTGIGGLCFQDGSAAAAAGEAPAVVIDALRSRKTQITPLKLPAVVAAACTFAVDCRGVDVLLFCDNQAACAAIGKEASQAPELQLFTTALHALCHHWRIALWVECVPTVAIPADELSRAGTSPYVAAPTRLMLPAWALASGSAPLRVLKYDAVYPFVPTRELRHHFQWGTIPEEPDSCDPGALAKVPWAAVGLCQAIHLRSPQVSGRGRSGSASPRLVWRDPRLRFYFRTVSWRGAG